MPEVLLHAGDCISVELISVTMTEVSCDSSTLEQVELEQVKASPSFGQLRRHVRHEAAFAGHERSCHSESAAGRPTDRIVLDVVGPRDRSV